ncbi:agamous-like MADS-box protein AGL80 [Dioscorea cayenensis subsp. rotundata]|uniref:Agamous-like MADS-box protein AGL80 n=1 Tax=Dioscorea cayennensis subsp. rotundata TaxID=55577 RepID=A0AB40AMG4_DIOCR|nr:agamous-like MADS-box protein AGL80 [Dioscorea cayenensis subsp. rotundata]
MGRVKVKLAWIEKDSSRNITYKKRKNGLLKKVRELSALCDVKACAIIYPWGGNVPEVWSSTPDPMDVLVPFMQKPELERRKKMVNQVRFLQQQIMKLEEHALKQEKENNELENMVLLGQCLKGKDLHGLYLETISSLNWLVDNKLKLVKEKVVKKKAEMAANGEGSLTTSAVGMHGWCLGFNEHNVIGGEKFGQPSCGNINNDDGDDDNIAWLDGFFPD